MGENSKIEWTDHTWNPWLGCSKVSPACTNCYAEGWAKRSGLVKWGVNAERRRTSESNWRQPLKWDKEAKKAGERRKVFCASLADVFEDRPELQPWRNDLFVVIEKTPHLDWLLLTKRPQNVLGQLEAIREHWMADRLPLFDNVWIGTTVENQEQADKRIPELLKIPARIRFLSCEPLLGPIRLLDEAPGVSAYFGGRSVFTYPPKHIEAGLRLDGIDWVIAGGESGPEARPMHPDWARSLRDQCQQAGVAFHFKQWGEWAPGGRVEADAEFAGGAVFNDPRGGRSSVRLIDLQPSRYRRLSDDTVLARIGKKAAGRLLDGVEHNDTAATGAQPTAA